MHNSTDTIAAIATPPGRGGVGIIRISGPAVPELAKKLLDKTPEPRYATYANFLAENNEVIDQGIALFFPNPHSFTGEDVLELQGHGGPVILDCLLKRILSLGARQAKPGEFSERAFLNNKIDLSQAEAIADLINADSETAALAAMRSLQGEFSQKIQSLLTELTQLRVYVEAAIDFPEEEINFLNDGKIAEGLSTLLIKVTAIKTAAQQGTILQEGMTLVIAGKPNAGKSSLLNALSGQDIAIVTEIPGTTRDVLRERIQIDGMPLHIIDTAGLRTSPDQIEQEGIRRAHLEFQRADQILLMLDVTSKQINIKTEIQELFSQTIDPKKIIVVYNKIDLNNEIAKTEKQDDFICVNISVKTKEGLDLLKTELKNRMHYQGNVEGNFIARRRHLDALERVEQLMLHGQQQLIESQAGELLAEDLRQAQQALGEITGKFTADALLGEIFSSFCIGK